MTRSHRNEDRGGEHRWTFNGVEYPTRKLMCEARRAEYVRLLDEEGMNFTQPRTRSASRNAPARRGATAGRAPREGTRNPGGLVSFHHGQTQDPPSALPEPGGAHPDRGTVCVWAIRSAPSPACWAATPARSAARSSATGIPSPAVTSPAAPSRRPRTGSNAPNRARRPRARDCGTRSPPGCAGIGARSR